MKKSLILMLLSFYSFNSWSMNKQEFENTISTIFNLYKNELDERFSSISMNVNWDGKTPNASVSRKDGQLRVYFDGEFVRKHQLNAPAFAITVCHEIGHVLGGEPRVYPSKKYSSEAQSDYFAASECLPRYYKTLKNPTFKKATLSQKLASKCQSEYCQWAMSALERELVIYAEEASLLKEDTKVVTYTNMNDYPSAQCRVDTIARAILGDERPRCWFNEEQEIKPWEYIVNYDYEEALISGVVKEVIPTDLGCLVKIKSLDFFSPSYISPLQENFIFASGIQVIGECKYLSGSSISGTVSEYRGLLYLNLNPNDK
ncbi:ImmA/IrrE family metallo-endopeptidase [Bacteriovorax sp. BSW11_IV]|uniref:ImmA/IrrE family metallo-endopeptidase n=1 Tax=Bacteriovorax sp. BSW11_IV TaxID=1353529 RepID=UPI0012DEEAEC|nr:hypothetical protein [Bacteriovorax sp. BSW11_IV]